MKQISNFLLAGLLILVFCSPVLSQDNAPKGNNPDISGGVDVQGQILDGPNPPSTQALTTVLPGNNSTSGNGRAPQGSRRFINVKYIITDAEMTASGFTGAVTHVGWRWNVPAPPAAGAPSSQSTATTGNLRVYLKDTVAGALTIGGTFIDTTGAGYTKVIDGTISIPSGLAEINIDVPVGGPGTGSYTPTPGSGVILIFVYKTTDATLPTPLGSPTVFCTAVGTGTKLLTFQSQTAGGSTGTASVFRPETRFGSFSGTDDVGITASNIFTSGRVYSVGKSYDFTATVRNFGTDTQTVVPVFYTLNGGSPVGPVNTVGPIAPLGTENVTFSGANTLTFIKGLNTIKIYTALAGDAFVINDTLTVTINVLNKITTYPHVQTFTNPVGWTVLTENPGGAVPIFGLLGIVTNPAGKAPDTAARANFFGAATGRREVLRSPEMDITSLTNPVLHFYVAYKTFGTANDSLEVVVSTNAGLTFFSATTVYNKGNSSIPSLATRPPSTTSFFPDSARQWRHETINLANVAGSTNLVIGFRGKSQFGNNAWIDNVIVTGADAYCESLVTPIPALYSCNTLLTVDFTTVGLRPVGNTDGKQIGNNTVTDNPGGGVLGVTTHLFDDPPSLASPEIAPNVSATNPSGTISQPNVVYQDHWFTVTYTGNDRLGYANYGILIDITTFTDTDSLYILKRADMTASWVALNTTVAGSNLSATFAANPITLSTFSDFAIGGDSIQQPLPVELSLFTSSVNRRDVNLNWTTVSEVNNSGFDVERSVVNGQWSKVGFVNGNGTTTSPKEYSLTDRGLNSGKYNYRLKQIDYNGNFAYYNLSNEVNVGVPTKFDLSQNYPNPFNPTTKINYDIPFDGKVSLKIFDMSGREVATLVNDVQTAGYYTINFNGSNLSSGVYFYRISVEGNGSSANGGFVATKKMMLVK